MKQDSLACAMDFFKAGEFVTYNEKGEEIIYKNYDTGKGRFKEKEFSLATKNALSKLKEKAGGATVITFSLSKRMAKRACSAMKAKHYCPFNTLK